MAEFSLPKNSKVQQGKVWPKPTGKRHCINGVCLVFRAA